METDQRAVTRTSAATATSDGGFLERNQRWLKPLAASLSALFMLALVQTLVGPVEALPDPVRAAVSLARMVIFFVFVPATLLMACSMAAQTATTSAKVAQWGIPIGCFAFAVSQFLQ